MYQVKRDTTDMHIHGHNYTVCTCFLKFIVEVHSKISVAISSYTSALNGYNYINIMFTESDALMHELYCILTGTSYQ